ncbi:MAG: MarR family transcriptional regulator [Inquilinus sp.]|nr:MarR family transcriptional regulator [Inquilinus sp.]
MTGEYGRETDLPASAGAAGAFDLERFFPYRLSVLANTVTRALAALYQAEHDLSIAEWRLLAIVARFGPISANGVCDRSAMDKVRVSRAVRRAVQRGFVHRAVDPRDRRRSRLTLTPAGRAIHDRIAALARDREAQILATLAPDEVDRLHDIISRLQTQAGAYGAADAALDTD